MAVKTLKPTRSVKDSFKVRVTDNWKGAEEICKADLTAHQYRDGKVHAVLAVKTPFGLKYQKFYFSGVKWDGLRNYSDRECKWQLPAPIRAVLAEMAD